LDAREARQQPGSLLFERGHIQLVEERAGAGGQVGRFGDGIGAGAVGADQQSPEIQAGTPQLGSEAEVGCP
jgi:hypothetical protein